MTFKNKTDRYYILFLLLAFALLLFGLGTYGLAETSEARYAEISREMFLSGDYLNPELLGIFHFHKPPITYYITTVGYRIFGINEWGARFFLQIAVIIQLFFVYGLANLLYRNRKVAFLSGLIYFSMPIVLISSRNLTTDAYLTTFILAAIYCWQLYVCHKRIIVLYSFYFLIGIALLTKGPVALLFIVTYILVEKIVFKRSLKIRLHHIMGILLCLAIGASWYVLVMVENPKLWDYFIQKQLVSRMNADSFNRAKPVWYYALLLTGLLFPWWVSIIPKFRSKIAQIKTLPRSGMVLLYCSLAVFLIFSAFTTKLILYILPMFWMPVVLIASQVSKIKSVTGKIISLTYLTLIGLLSLGVIGIWIIGIPLIKSTTYASLIALGVLIASFIIYLIIDNEKRYKPACMAAVFGGGLLLISSAVLSANSALINSTRDMVGFINHISTESDKTIVVDDYLLTSIPFYTDAQLITLKDDRNTTQREIQFENDQKWKEGLWDVHDPMTLSKMDSVSKKDGNFLLLSNREAIQGNLGFLKSRYNSEKVYPKWRLYYNRRAL
ncbi:ArnT family glycosyltransferase [Flavimarina sp. Hel_I_48]|uniref:ArnT family glycosyltransferase n=1 Tax=Flavimarina sp. Hel_I_48 TaxID=1392488 RepID=UPI0004DF4B7E|nr:glycosyltransferase family 39 protein [Flavimarina sp. Hel_I_48]